MEPCINHTPDAWTVTAVPAFTDNYIWTMLSPDRQRATVVDPGDAAPVLAFCQKAGAALTDILITHHHPDHTAGIPLLKQTYPDARVWGPAGERIAGVETPLREGDTVAIGGLNRAFLVLDIPGHTAGHIAYYHPAMDWLFCGDTLFAAGCGRLFEGTPQQMFASLQKLGSLPSQTRVFCTHEYTHSNLRFAQEAEADNPAIHARAQTVASLRAQGACTLPSSIGLEWETNPFLRARDASHFAALRQQKDNF